MPPQARPVAIPGQAAESFDSAIPGIQDDNSVITIYV
jgi:hypothetical protein